MPGRLLGDLLADATSMSAELREAELRGSPATMITDVVLDSRRVRPGSLFCCIRGEHDNGHDFAGEAASAGAAALLVDHPLDIEVPQVIVNGTRLAMGYLAAAACDQPSRSLIMIGVTGTNGKTTTSALIASVLEAAGIHAGVIGTLTGTHTTPEAPELQARLAGFVAEGRSAVVMEVSSHALALHRVAGCRFKVAVFTNLGHDHLDLHGTVERYFAAKASLFQPEMSERGLTNVDDLHGRLLLDAAGIPMETYSSEELVDLEVTPTAHAYTWRGQRIEVAVGGAFNAMNSLAAAKVAASLGIALPVIAQGLAAVDSIPGRFEPVRAGQPFDVIVDFAHTPDGLRSALGAARAAAGAGRLIAVFGCGGDRDREKRPEMGAVAALLADQVVVTSDNPRSEDPLEIINAIVEGVPADYRRRVVSEPDRRRAFAMAFQMAQAGDVVIIAGKGHETTQIVGTRTIPFDDRVVARSLLEAGR